jgi:hypothetical protein
MKLLVIDERAYAMQVDPLEIGRVMNRNLAEYHGPAMPTSR